jgi:hypothetical protein
MPPTRGTAVACSERALGLSSASLPARVLSNIQTTVTLTAKATAAGANNAVA